jgi:hypothetical protein
MYLPECLYDVISGMKRPVKLEEQARYLVVESLTHYRGLMDRLLSEE